MKASLKNAKIICPECMRDVPKRGNMETPVFLVKIKQLQVNEGLQLANKINKRHISFRNELMKVKLATQMLSKSVATCSVFFFFFL